MLLHAIFALFILVTIDAVYVNSVSFKHIDSSSHFLELNCIECSILIISKQLFIDGDIETNLGPAQNNCRYQLGIKYSKKHQKNVILVKTLLLLLLVIQTYFFFNIIQPVSLDIIHPWSITCSGIVESLQKMKSEVNNDISSNISVSQ